MLALKIIGIIALIIFAVCMITVGVDINYIDKKFTLSAKFCGILIQLFPKKKKRTPKKVKKDTPEKAEKPAKEKEKKPKKERPKKKSKGLSLNFSGDEIMALIKKVLNGLGKFNHGFNVDRFYLDWVATGKDPYETAKTFAYVNAALSGFAPLCAERFRCKDCYVRTDIDFTETDLILDFGIAVVLRIGAIFRMLNTILFGAVGILIKNKFRWLWMKLFHKDEYLEEMEIAEERAEKMANLLEKLKSKKASEDAADETDDEIQAVQN